MLTADTVTQQAIFEARGDVGKVAMSEVIERYIVDLVFASRYPDRYDETLASWIDLGVSPRATLALDQCSRIHAWLQQRDFVTPEDVRSVVHDVFRHRVSSSYEAQAQGINNDKIIDRMLELVALPG